MDERTLLLLGMLRLQSQHGYQLNEFIEHNLARVTDMKKPTAYALLDRLEQSGAIASRLEQEGNRPPRKVYAITPEGERLFATLLRETLASASPYVVASDVGLMFLDALELSESMALLGRRLAAVREQIAQVVTIPPHKLGIGVDLAIEHQLVLLRADEVWLAQLIERLKRREPAITPADATAHQTRE